MKRAKHVLSAGFFLFLAALPAHAVTPDEVLKDPALEARARAISTELRCLVCQNQSIDDSDAELAKDLRVIVREKISAGASDNEIKQFLVARYGEFVLLRPPFSTGTALLWTLPFLALLGGGLFLIRSARAKRGQPVSVTPLSEAERVALDARLDDAAKG
jgi:cytochrome c-type biogenesis protein CcmH